MMQFKGYLHFNPSDGKNNLSEGFFPPPPLPPQRWLLGICISSTRKMHSTSSLNCLLVIDDLFSLPIPPHLPSPGLQYAFGAHLFYFSPLSKRLLLLPLGPVVCNSLYLLRWKTGQSPDHWFLGSLEAVSRGSLDLCRKLASSPIHCALPGRAFLLLFPASSLFPGLDHDSFMKTQREMGLLRVLLGKSYFVFMMTFLSSAAEGP